MSVPRYQKYKDSGVPWLDDVPEHWDLKRLKFFASLVTEKTDNRTFPVALENIEGWTGNYIETETDFQSDGVSFLKNDVLFGKLRPYLAKVWLAAQSGEAVGDFHVMRPKPNVNPRLLQYHILNKDIISIIDSSTYGAKMPRASWEFVSNILLAFPTEAHEQKSIVDFLERETVKIDSLVAEQERLIELLREKRQAVISHAVTKGLNPNAPMKQSSIDWLGDIPAHWDINKIGRIAFMQEGPGLRTWQFTDEGTRVICVTNITENGIDFSRLEKFISDDEYKSNYQHFTVEEGDVLLSSSGNSWGKVAVYLEQEAVILNTSTIRLNELVKPLVLRDNLVFLLQSIHVREQLNIAMTGSCQPNFGPTHLNKVIVAIPPKDEQIAISNYLKQEIETIKGLIAQAKKAIDLLQERRTALISAAVTGKIDVRGVASTQNKEAA